MAWTLTYDLFLFAFVYSFFSVRVPPNIYVPKNVEDVCPIQSFGKSLKVWVLTELMKPVGGLGEVIRYFYCFCPPAAPSKTNVPTITGRKVLSRASGMVWTLSYDQLSVYLSFRTFQHCRVPHFGSRQTECWVQDLCTIRNFGT